MKSKLSLTIEDLKQLGIIGSNAKVKVIRKTKKAKVSVKKRRNKKLYKTLSSGVKSSSDHMKTTIIETKPIQFFNSSNLGTEIQTEQLKNMKANNLLLKDGSKDTNEEISTKVKEIALPFIQRFQEITDEKFRLMDKTNEYNIRQLEDDIENSSNNKYVNFYRSENDINLQDDAGNFGTTPGSEQFQQQGNNISEASALHNSNFQDISIRPSNLWDSYIKDMKPIDSQYLHILEKASENYKIHKDKQEQPKSNISIRPRNLYDTFLKNSGKGQSFSEILEEYKSEKETDVNTLNDASIFPSEKILEPEPNTEPKTEPKTEQKPKPKPKPKPEPEQEQEKVKEQAQEPEHIIKLTKQSKETIKLLQKGGKGISDTRINLEDLYKRLVKDPDPARLKSTDKALQGELRRLLKTNKINIPNEK